MILRVVIAIVLTLLAFTACEHYMKTARLDREQVARNKANADEKAAREARLKAQRESREEQFKTKRAEILAETKRLIAKREWRLARQELEPWDAQVTADGDFVPLKSKIDTEVRAIEARENAIAAKELAAAKRKAGVSIGMSQDDVLASQWGKPEKVNRTVHARSVSEQWVYPGYQYLYFENGKLTSIQNSR